MRAGSRNTASSARTSLDRYQGVGSGEGIKRFLAGTVDFGASDAAMSDADLAKVDPAAAPS